MSDNFDFSKDHLSTETVQRDAPSPTTISNDELEHVLADFPDLPEESQAMDIDLVNDSEDELALTNQSEGEESSDEAIFDNLQNSQDSEISLEMNANEEDESNLISVFEDPDSKFIIPVEYVHVCAYATLKITKQKIKVHYEDFKESFSKIKKQDFNKLKDKGIVLETDPVNTIFVGRLGFDKVYSFFDESVLGAFVVGHRKEDGIRYEGKVVQPDQFIKEFDPKDTECNIACFLNGSQKNIFKVLKKAFNTDKGLFYLKDKSHNLLDVGYKTFNELSISKHLWELLKKKKRSSVCTLTMNKTILGREIKRKYTFSDKIESLFN